MFFDICQEGNSASANELRVACLCFFFRLGGLQPHFTAAVYFERALEF